MSSFPRWKCSEHYRNCCRRNLRDSTVRDSIPCCHKLHRTSSAYYSHVLTSYTEPPLRTTPMFSLVTQNLLCVLLPCSHKLHRTSSAYYCHVLTSYTEPPLRITVLWSSGCCTLYATCCIPGHVTGFLVNGSVPTTDKLPSNFIWPVQQ
jgi:hypothetical protein